MIKKEILKYSYKHNLGHIPSALSMCDYVESVFKFVKKDDKICLGKPFGAQTYYIIWKNLGWLNDIDILHMAVKHDEIDFVDYSEETMGNALGVASGIAMTTEKKVYVNLSDSSLQMGNTIEAIQFIGQHQQNILVTVDYNNAQVTGTIDEIIDIKPVFNLAESYGWKVYHLYKTDNAELVFREAYNYKIPVLIVCHTIKGDGISSMEKEIKKWHYKKIDSEIELRSLEQELPDT